MQAPFEERSSCHFRSAACPVAIPSPHVRSPNSLPQSSHDNLSLAGGEKKKRAPENSLAI